MFSLIFTTALVYWTHRMKRNPMDLKLFAIAKATLYISMYSHSYVLLYISTSFYDFRFVLHSRPSAHILLLFLLVFLFILLFFLLWKRFIDVCERKRTLLQKKKSRTKNRNIYGEWSQNECHVIRCCWQHLSLLILASDDFIVVYMNLLARLSRPITSST